MSKLKQLTALWYKKLAKSGFEDIEDTNSQNEMLKDWHSLKFLGPHKKGRFEAQKRYYELACQFLHDHYFETSREKAIWAKHTDGQTIREIAKQHKVSANTIGLILKRLRDVMLDRAD